MLSCNLTGIHMGDLREKSKRAICVDLMPLYARIDEGDVKLLTVMGDDCCRVYKKAMKRFNKRVVVINGLFPGRVIPKTIYAGRV